MKTYQDIAGEFAAAVNAYEVEQYDADGLLCAALAAYEQRVAAGDEQPQQVARPWQEQAAEWLERNHCLSLSADVQIAVNGYLEKLSAELRSEAEQSQPQPMPEIYLLCVNQSGRLLYMNADDRLDALQTELQAYQDAFTGYEIFRVTAMERVK